MIRLGSRPASALAALGLLLLASASAAEQSPAEALIGAARTLVIAHRGDSLIAPENTLPAFQSAVEAGADLVELDYLHSADGVPVVIHDDTLDRTTDAKSVFGGEKISIGSKSLKDLEQLDAGAWFHPKFAGARLPTLDAALDTIQKGSMTLIERKGGDAKTLVDLLRQKNLLNDVVVQAFDWQFLADCHELAPELVLGALGAKEINEAKLKQIRATGAKVIGWQYLYLTRQRIEHLHAEGFKVWAWTVDEPRWATRLVKWGLDGVITDKPTEIKSLLAEQPAPAATEQAAEVGQ